VDAAAARQEEVVTDLGNTGLEPEPEPDPDLKLDLPRRQEAQVFVSYAVQCHYRGTAQATGERQWSGEHGDGADNVATVKGGRVRDLRVARRGETRRGSEEVPGVLDAVGGSTCDLHRGV
jgi:hypothetical protein